MLIQSSLPSSIEASLFYVSAHRKQDLICDWMPGTENWQMCPQCGEHSQGGCKEAVSKKRKVDSCPLEFPKTCSQQSALSSMPSSSAPTFVYSRRKQQGKYAATFSGEASTNSKRSDLHSVVSSDTPSMLAKEKDGVSQVEPETEDAGATMIPLICSTEPHILSIEFTNGCSSVRGQESENALRNMQKAIEVDGIDDSCSSTKSNVEHVSASLKGEMDEPGECSSSSTRVMDVAMEGLSDHDKCIFILKNKGVLVERDFVGRNQFSEDIGISSQNSQTVACKVCGHSESALKMLICDHCEEAFHLTCCKPQIKKIPVEEWFCSSCFKIHLKETTTTKPASINSVMGGNENASSKAKSNPIALMLRESDTHVSDVRIGKSFQADVPDWSGPIYDDVDAIGEPLEIDPSEYTNSHDLIPSELHKLSPMGNWLQCRNVIEGRVCGKWRRAPLFQIQTDKWECFCCVFWDPVRADCAVPQELETDQVLKQLKCLGKMRSQISAKTKRRKSDGTKNP